MKIRHLSQAPRSGASAHRAGGISFIHLMEGEEWAKDNFGLTLVHVEDGYTAPRHRHNFEQVRIMLEGDFEFGPGLSQTEGTVGYFCEGTYYTQKGVGPSTTLLLQVAGASGDGYVSQDLLRSTIAKLQTWGTFDNGVFTWEENGKRHNKDGYEAAWEQANGRAIAYSPTRYNAPIIMDPGTFAFVPLAEGVERKTLGRFNERGLEISQLKIAAGVRHVLDATAQPLLFHALAGEGTIGEEQWWKGTSILVERGDRIELTATEEALFYCFGLPIFDEAA